MQRRRKKEFRSKILAALRSWVASSLNDFLHILTNVENQSPTRIIKIVRNPCILLALITERNDVLDVRILSIE